MMKRKWWIFVGLLVLCLAVSFSFYSVRVRLAPRLMLSQGLKNTFAQLGTRYQNSPVHLFDGILNIRGRQKAHLQLETEHRNLGITRYDMDLKTQLSPNRIQAEGMVIAAGKALNLSLYLDEHFAAVSSRELVSEKYYGITYDTFSDDIRARDMVALLLGENKLNEWEQTVDDLKKNMAVDLWIPEFTMEDIQNVLFGILTLKPRVESVQTVVAGNNVKANAVRFYATGPEISEIVSDYTDQIPGSLRKLVNELADQSDSGIEAEFILHMDHVIQMEITLTVNGKEDHVLIKPGIDTMEISISRREGSDLYRQLISVQTTQSASVYEENIKLTSIRNGIRSQSGIQYVWGIVSQELTLGLNTQEKSASFRAHLVREEDRLTITSQDVSGIMNLFLKKPLERPAICTLTLTSGEEVDTPEYLNLDQWSWEDLLALLSGIGGLLGLKPQS